MPPSSTSSSSSGSSGPGSNSRRARAFALRVATFALPLLIVAGIGHSILYAASDAWSMAHVLAFEQESRDRGQETLFQRGFVAEEMRRYKLENTLARQPAVLALGSSTVMQIRAQAFGPHAPEFYNAGGFVQHLGILTQSQELLALLPKLRVVIAGFDLWWFNDGYLGRNKYLSVEFLRNTPAFNQDFRARIGALPIFIETFTKKGGFSGVGEFLSRWNRPEPPGMPGAFGIGLGGRRGMGFRGEDGSFRYGDYIARAARGGEYVDNFGVVERIARGARRMDYGRFMPARLEHVEGFLRWCDERDIVVAGFAVPLASEVREALAKSPNHPGLLADYQRELRANFEQAGMPYVDALDLFGRDDRHMVDGIHASEVVLAEVVLRLLDHPRMQAALPGLEPAYLEALLAHEDTTFAELARRTP